MADTTFLDNLNLIRMDKDEVRVTVAGLLFVGKAASLARLLPQAEVIYLHYSDEAQTEYDNRMDMQERRSADGIRQPHGYAGAGDLDSG